MANSAHPKSTMRGAIRSAAGDQDDSWLRNLGSVGVWGLWGGRLTNTLRLSADIEMAGAKSHLLKLG
jgi:hypothetical protein